MISKIQANNIGFSAKISDNFLSAAENYFYENPKIPEKKYKQFNSAIRRFEELAEIDHITIDYKKNVKNGQIQHSIVGINEATKEEVKLTSKDMFRKAVEKFSYMNEYEFLLKMGLLKKNN